MKLDELEDYRYFAEEHIDGGSSLYSFKKKKKMTGHNIKIFLGLAAIFVLGGLQALHGIGGAGAWVETLLPIVLAIEHIVNGKTSA